ncbi:MAG: hypothetical protein R2741_03760 [Methanolobus sp.]
MRILRDIFTSSGYEVTDSFRHDLVAEKNGMKTVIKLSYTPDPGELNEFAGQLTEGQGLYVIAGDADENILRKARAAGVRIWTRDDVALQIGRAVLADMEGKTAELDLIGTAVQKPVSKVEEVAQEAINAIFGTGTSSLVEQKAFEEPSFSLASKPTVSATERMAEVRYYRPGTSSPEPTLEDQDVEILSNAPEVPAEKPPLVQNAQSVPLTDDSIIMSLHSSPVNIQKDRALSIATPFVRGANSAILKFVPFWKYNYSLDVEHRYRSKIIDISGDGSGCLNALNGNVETMHLDDVRKTVAVPNVEYDVKMAVTTEDDARKQLLDMLIDEYTRDQGFDATQGMQLSLSTNGLSQQPKI